jgi:hypothetical protein
MCFIVNYFRGLRPRPVQKIVPRKRLKAFFRLKSQFFLEKAKLFQRDTKIYTETGRLKKKYNFLNPPETGTIFETYQYMRTYGPHITISRYPDIDF